MNVIMTRPKQKHGNILWEPFATSTPLKIAPNDAKIGYLLHKQLLSDSDNLTGKSSKRVSTSNILHDCLIKSKNVTKKVKKNRSSAYFDLSSSSSSDEDSDENKKRPIIKVSSQKTRSLLNSKKTETEVGASTCEKVDNSKKVKNVKNSEKNKLPVMNLRSRNGKRPNVKNKTKGGDANLDLDNIGESSEEGKIFDETNKNLVKTAECDEKSKDNQNNPSKVEENVKKSDQQSDVHKLEKSVSVKSANISDNKLVDEKNSEASSNNKELKVLKRKGTEMEHNAGPVKRLFSKKHSKLTTSSATPLYVSMHIWDKKLDLSHQLFSDSREQEFINTLDLTSDDINEAIEKEKCLVQRLLTPKKQFLSINQKKDEPACEEAKQERPVRRKQKPKEFWMPENESSLHPTAVSTSKPKTKRNTKVSTKTKQQSVPKAEEENKCDDIKENSNVGKTVTKKVGSPKGGKKLRKKVGIVLKESKVNSQNDGGFAERYEKNKEINYAFSCSGLSENINKGTDLNESQETNFGAEKKEVTQEKTVFKLLNELSFSENEVGCSVVQCQSIKNFKCGVLKVKANCKFNCRTLHSNSHLGGVVVKGIINMKIGEKELKLKEGDMAFVPPLTDWQVTNIGHSESVFYYWCGRFK